MGQTTNRSLELRRLQLARRRAIAALAHTGDPGDVPLTDDITALIKRLAADIRKRPDDAELLAIRIRALFRLKVAALYPHQPGSILER